MNNEELKKKIVEIVWKAWEEPVPCTAERKFERIADALIAARIGDVKTAQEIGASATAMAVLEAAKAEHRAARAERALENACVVILSSRNGDQPRRLRAYYKAYLEAAEKELAEENE